MMRNRNRQRKEKPIMAKRATATAEATNEEASTSNSMDVITIAGRQFQVRAPYTPGQSVILSEGEAHTLNQVRHENIRNNFAKRVKDVGEDAEKLAALQSDLAKYDEAYQFGVRQGGPRVTDPVKRRALEIVTGKIEAQLRAKGIKMKDVSREEIRQRAERAVAENPIYMETARKAIEAEDSLGSESFVE